MIISHKHKFIYIKTKKTASTSIEMEISKFCGPKDVITPIGPEDERKRINSETMKSMQNYHIGFKKYSAKDYLKLLKNKRKKKFTNHDSAKYIKNNVKKEVWENYFKFTFDRNPFDRAVSFYYFSTSEPRPDIGEYLNRVSKSRLSNWERYTVNDHIAVDFLGRYENISEEISRVCEKIGIEENIELPKSKSGYRPEKSEYKQVMNDMAKKRIKVVCAKELEKLKYEW